MIPFCSFACPFVYFDSARLKIMVQTRNRRNTADLRDTLSRPNASHTNSGASVHRHAAQNNAPMVQNNRSPTRQRFPLLPAPAQGAPGREELRAGLTSVLDLVVTRVLDAYLGGEGQQAPPPTRPKGSPPRND